MLIFLQNKQKKTTWNNTLMTEFDTINKSVFFRTLF